MPLTKAGSGFYQRWQSVRWKCRTTAFFLAFMYLSVVSATLTSAHDSQRSSDLQLSSSLTFSELLLKQANVS